MEQNNNLISSGSNQVSNNQNQAAANPNQASNVQSGSGNNLSYQNRGYGTYTGNTLGTNTQTGNNQYNYGGNRTGQYSGNYSYENPYTTGRTSQNTYGASKTSPNSYGNSSYSAYGNTGGSSYAGSSNSYGNASANNTQYYGNVPSVTVQNTKKKKKGGFFKKIGLGLAVGLVFGVGLSGGVFFINKLTGSNQSVSLSGNTSEEEISNLQKQIDNLTKKLANTTADDSGVTTLNSNESSISVVTDVTEVVDKVMPSMVSITNLSETTISYWGRQYVQESQASGSGIIIGENDTEILIVTNHHVIEDNVQLTVQFVDEFQAAAYVKGYDSSMDVAVIAVLKEDLNEETKGSISIATIGDSDALKIGEPAIAIGNALGYGQSVTTGVISALNRDIEMDDVCDCLIQTSAAINPGNSGGALLNIKGEVIGINSNKIGGTSVEGMGYAIPVNAVKDIITDFMNRETMVKASEDQRGYLGISGATVDETTASTYGIPEGVYVTKVYERSAALEAGILKGDIITKVNSQSITTMEELQEALSYYKGGETVRITVLRAGLSGYEETNLDVVLILKTDIEG